MPDGGFLIVIFFESAKVVSTGIPRFLYEWTCLSAAAASMLPYGTKFNLLRRLISFMPIQYTGVTW